LCVPSTSLQVGSIARSAKDILCQSAKGARRVPSDLLRFGPMQVPSSGTVRFCRCLMPRGRHSGHGGLCPRICSDISP
jgi:hypothetical protein